MPEWIISAVFDQRKDERRKLKIKTKFHKLESHIRIDQDQEGQRGPGGSSQLRQRKENFESWMTIESPLKKIEKEIPEDKSWNEYFEGRAAETLIRSDVSSSDLAELVEVWTSDWFENQPVGVEVVQKVIKKPCVSVTLILFKLCPHGWTSGTTETHTFSP